MESSLLQTSDSEIPFHRHHVSYRQPAGLDDDDLPEFSFSHAVSCEVRAQPEYIVLDLDLVRQMESTVFWQHLS